MCEEVAVLFDSGVFIEGGMMRTLFSREFYLVSFVLRLLRIFEIKA